MENFQLYRTNLLLGGQMKWDIIIESSNSSLYVSDFHLRPISNNVPYTYKSEETLINNTHQENVKTFYNSIKGNFYSEALDSIFTHNWPIICSENEKLNSYSNTYDMGCKRMKSYSMYKKQFEFFCPIWIEKLNDIKINFIAKAKNSNVVLSSKSLKLNSILNDSYSEYHDKFAKYFNEYINSSKLNIGDDNLLNIKFNDGAKIYGLDASTGIFCSKNINSLIDNMLLRERPLMETDNMIVQSFVNNTITAKQLFNLNFCFNFDDIMSKNIMNMLSGENIVVYLEIFVDGKKLEKRDFYTNYEFIERCTYGDNTNDSLNSLNVLDYLHDNASIELINKNKFCQSIFHWSLLENNDYIFNLYEGFSGIRMDKDVYFENSHQYKNNSNLTNTNATNINEITWINAEKITTWNAFYKYISNTDKNKLKGSYICENNFINGIKYNNVPKVVVDGVEGIYVIGLYVTKNIFINIINNIERFNLIKIPINDSMFILRKENLIMIVTKDLNNLTYKGFYDVLINQEDEIYDTLMAISNNLQNEKIYIDTLYTIMNNVVNPELIKFNGGLLWTAAIGPTNDVKEIEYIKDNTIKNYLLRYDGKLKPTFISEPKNIIYYKDYVSDNRNSESKLVKSKYYTYMDTGFEPIYPSLNYCAINSISKYDYDNLPIGNISEHDKSEIMNTIEYSWFNINNCISLDPELNFSYTNKKSEGYKKLSEILKHCISKYYSIDNEEIVNYIVSKYDISSNWEYFSDTNVEDYIYDITLTLK